MNTLYEPSFEHDNCGIGAVVSIEGIKSRKVVDRALSIVEKLEPATVLEFCFRFAMIFLRKLPAKQELCLVMKANTE